MSDHVLEVDSTDGTYIDYYFEASGFVKDLGIDHFDEIGEKHVDGSLSGGVDRIGFNGIPEGFVIKSGFDSLSLTLDGNPIEPSHLNSHLAIVRGTGTKASYELTASEGIIRDLVDDQSFEGNDNIFDGTTARGAVVGGQDAYRLWGTPTGFWSNADVDLILDGKEVPIEGNAPTGI